LLLEKISQSLAGRVAIAHLLPLSYQEIKSHIVNINIDTLIFNGGYPRIYAKHINPNDWHKSYINTYVERDVRQIKNISNLSTFQRFIRLCAGRVGQLLNIASLATECGIDQTTARSWISILETSFLVFLLKPHHKNFNKRLVKQPKLYFYDTGLMCYLLGIEKPQDLLNHYARGHLFENFVIGELIKQLFNHGKEHNLYFWRDHHGHEIDLVIEQGQNLIPVEIKSGQTISTDFFKGIKYWQDLSNSATGFVIYAGTTNQIRTNINILSWKNLQQIIS
jgi:predicted AAA+ superfamily ATPase